jgi:O-antigen ligase
MNENEVGPLSLLLMPGIVWPFIRNPKEAHVWGRLYVLIYLILVIGLTVMSGSRGGAISLAITLAVFWVWRSTRPIGKLSMILLILAVLLAPFLFTTLVERFLVTSDDTFLGGREALWKAAWQLIQSHSLGGTGIGNASFEIVPYLETTHHIFFESVSFHNPLLAIWGDVGLIGLLLYLGVLLGAIYSFAVNWRYFRTQNNHYLHSYFPLIAAVFLGFMLSWIKGGGMEFNKTYFLMIALLLIPDCIRLSGIEKSEITPAAPN